MAKATLGGGCFWCLEAVYLELRGVTRVVSGYAGGHDPNPNYRAVCAGGTGHAEVVQIEFDPSVVPYQALLEVFFVTHDPTTPNRQGADVGTQYRSIILTHDPEQETQAKSVLGWAQTLWDAPIVTEIQALKQFFEAEPEHHNYFALHPNQPYCRAVVAPKVIKTRQAFASLLRG